MSVTIIMYHYVRPIRESRYPEIKGLEKYLFAEQLHYVRKHYVVVAAKDVVRWAHGEGRLPGNAALLTFDDGYLDHFTHVFPLLYNLGLPGCFFPPARCISERVVLDVNKIHYVLAATPDKSNIITKMHAKIEKARDEFDLDSLDIYRTRYMTANSFDSAEVIYIKRMLQVGLPEILRARVIGELFRLYVTEDERAFANELYMDEAQLRCMIEAGMSVGSHGFNHFWMNGLDRLAQERDVDLSLEFLGRIGATTRDWVMCYPYGAWNAGLLDVLRARGCALGLTTEEAIADLEKADPLLLPRIDTNSLPKDRNAAPSHWTLRALGSK